MPQKVNIKSWIWCHMVSLGHNELMDYLFHAHAFDFFQSFSVASRGDTLSTWTGRASAPWKSKHLCWMEYKLPLSLTKMPPDTRAGSAGAHHFLNPDATLIISRLCVSLLPASLAGKLDAVNWSFDEFSQKRCSFVAMCQSSISFAHHYAQWGVTCNKVKYIVIILHSSQHIEGRTQGRLWTLYTPHSSYSWVSRVHSRQGNVREK